MNTQQKFCKVKSRDGKDLNLFTGLFYQITVKSIPNGIMTFEEEARGQESNFIQLALNYLEDFDTPSVDNEWVEGPLARQALWTILPELGSKENDYQLNVLSHSEGKLTYTHGSSWGGRYMELDLTNLESYSRGANMYSSCLWHFNPTEFQDFFTIHNSDPRRDPNFMTFSNEPSERGQLMQIGTKELENYSPKGIFRNDAVWQLRPKNYKLFAHVTNFDFEEPSEEEISDEAFPIQIMEEDLTGSDHKKIDFSIKLPELFKLNFMQSFKPFPENNISFDSRCFDGEHHLKFMKGKPQLKFEKKYGSNTQFICEVETEYKIQQEFQFPESVQKVRVKGYCSTVKEIEIPFRATVQITAKANCFDPNTGLEIIDDEIDSREVIEYFLKYKKFTGKIKGVEKKAPTPISRVIKTVSSPATKSISCELGSVVNCEVTGRLKCTCGLDTYIDVKDISCES